MHKKKEAQVFENWFHNLPRQAFMHVKSCIIDVGPISSTYTLVVDGDIAEPVGAPPESKAFLHNRSVTYTPIQERNWCFSEQRDVTRFRKGPPFTTFTYLVYHQELES